MTKDEALKLALEALEWTLPLIEDFGNKEQLNKQHKAIASLYEAQAQSAQKTATGIQYAQGIPFFIPPAAQPAQEPVAWYYKIYETKGISFYRDNDLSKPWKPLYTAPPKRPWVGLTDEEVQDSYNADYQAQTRAVEAKLKEKNT